MHMEVDQKNERNKIKMDKKNKKFPKKTFWFLTIISIFFGILHFFIWSGLVGHYRNFELYFLNLFILSTPTIIFLLLIINNFYHLNKFDKDKLKSLKYMGVTTLIFGIIIFIIFSGFVSAAPISSHPEVFLMPLISPLLLITLGIILIFYSKK